MTDAQGAMASISPNARKNRLTHREREADARDDRDDVEDHRQRDRPGP